MTNNRSSFSGQLGFILAAAASAVGLGNIWRFPYLAAKDGGGFFILIYLIVTLTFGFTLLLTEIAIGRKTRQGPLTAYGMIHQKWKWVGVVACLVPTIILPYYCVIGGWVLKYLATYVTFNSAAAAESSFFTGFITAYSPLVWFIIFFVFVAAVILAGVEKGIEKVSKILMPILVVMIVLIAGFSLTLEHTDAATNVTRTGLDGLKVYLIPDFASQTPKSVLITIMDAVGQLFFSISVAMGIMVAYGSYAKPTANIGAATNRIEFFDTAIALLAGMMIIPAVFAFMGSEGMASGGPSLMFVTLPKVFVAMGSTVGTIVAIVFFAGMLISIIVRSFQLGILSYAMKHKSLWEKTLENGIRICCRKGRFSPYSWMKTIVISEEDWRDGQHEIILHESGHIFAHHSYDMLLLMVCQAVQWYNPFVWVMSRSLAEVHEYEADQYVLEQGVSSSEYMMLLLKKVAREKNYSFVNGFNKNSIKQNY